MAEWGAIVVADPDTFDGFDTKSYDPRCSFEENPRLGGWNGIPQNLDYSLNRCRHDDFADWLGTVRTSHPGLECNLMDQYLVSLSSLLKRNGEEHNINKRVTNLQEVERNFSTFQLLILNGELWIFNFHSKHFKRISIECNDWHSMHWGTHTRGK